MDYENLVQALQENKIDYLTFISEQEDLKEEFLLFLRREKKEKTNENAKTWLHDYENEILFDSENEKEALAL